MERHSSNGAEALLDRRSFARTALIAAGGTAAAVGFAPGVADAASKKKKKKKARCPKDVAPKILENTGVGMYTDASVANQTSGFTINPYTVSCAVGTLATHGPGVNPGPFTMLMFATRMDALVVDRPNGVLKATGRMRSITVTGGQTTEDTEHDFIAVARDGRGNTKDRFDVHFKTPFWTPGQNPMATPSSDFPGLARFGGELLMGYVTALR